MVTLVMFAFLSINVVYGILMNNPCQLEPHYPSGIPTDPNFTTTIRVPSTCKNGTFVWNYPRGHTILHFPIDGRVETKICFGDDVGGEILTIVDMTEGVNFTLPRVERGHREPTICTLVYDMGEILLRIDAPSTLYYIGGLTYRVKS